MTEHTDGLNGALVEFFRAEMAAQRMTQPELAKLSGLPTVSLQRYLAAKRGMDVAIVERIAGAFGLTVIEAATRAEAAREDRLRRSTGSDSAESAG